MRHFIHKLPSKRRYLSWGARFTRSILGSDIRLEKERSRTSSCRNVRPKAILILKL